MKFKFDQWYKFDNREDKKRFIDAAFVGCAKPRFEKDFYMSCVLLKIEVTPCAYYLRYRTPNRNSDYEYFNPVLFKYEPNLGGSNEELPKFTSTKLVSIDYLEKNIDDRSFIYKELLSNHFEEHRSLQAKNSKISKELDFIRDKVKRFLKLLKQIDPTINKFKLDFVEAERFVYETSDQAYTRLLAEYNSLEYQLYSLFVGENL